MKNFTKFIFSALLVFSLFNIDTVNIKRDGITFKQNQLFAQDINSVWKDIPGSALAGKDLKAIKIEKFRSIIIPIERNAAA